MCIRDSHTPPVKPPVLVHHGSKGDINERSLLWRERFPVFRNRRANKGVLLRKCFRHRLKFLRSVNDGFCLIVILNDTDKIIHAITVRLQQLHHFIDARQPKHAVAHLFQSGPHQFCCVLVERKSCSRTDERNAQLFCK